MTAPASGQFPLSRLSCCTSRCVSYPVPSIRSDHLISPVVCPKASDWIVSSSEQCAPEIVTAPASGQFPLSRLSCGTIPCVSYLVPSIRSDIASLLCLLCTHVSQSIRLDGLSSLVSLIFYGVPHVIQCTECGSESLGHFTPANVILSIDISI